MKKFLLTTMAMAAMLFAPLSANAQDKSEYKAPLVYNFAGLVEDNDLINVEGPTFFLYENEYKPDVNRYSFYGYQDYEGDALGKECHIWRRFDRLSGNLTSEGLACPNDREMAIDGLGAGSKVKIFYDNSEVLGDTPEEKSIVWITGASAGTEAEIDGVAPEAGVTVIPSGAEITIKSGEYIVFKVREGMIVSKVEIVNKAGYDYENAATVKNDFAAEAAPIILELTNKNGSASNGEAFYVWENEGKVDSYRQDFKGYAWTEGLDMPEVCRVWRRGDRLQGNVIAEGLKCPNDKEMVINGLVAGSVVKITYDATNAAEGSKQMIWATGATAGTVATIGDVEAVSGETLFDSNAEIKIVSTENGYFGFKVKKNMIISKVEIKNPDETFVYNFAARRNDLTNLNGKASNGGAFYVWEKADKADSYRQDFKGYENYTGTNLPEVCQVWRRSDRLSGNLVDGGLKCPNDREMVISGLKDGYKVKIFFDATNAAEGAKQMIWATGATAATVAEINGKEAVSGETSFDSGDEITIKSTASGYFGFKVKKNMIISNIEIVVPEAKMDTVVNDFTAAGIIIPVQPTNLNGSTKNGQVFYIWEKEDKTNSLRQDYKGYEWKEGLALPEVCHVWRRSDRINGNIIAGGLKCPNDREMVVDGLESGCSVIITYDASKAATTNAETGETTVPKIVYATGSESTTLAKVNGPLAVPGVTEIPSEAIVEIPYTVDGYIAFKVKKNMVISKIEIRYYNPISTGIENAAVNETEDTWFNMQGVRVAQPTKGVYIHKGKKVVVK